MIREVVIGVRGGVAEVDKNPTNIPIEIVDWDNITSESVNIYSLNTAKDVLGEKIYNKSLVIEVLGGVATISHLYPNCKCWINDYDDDESYFEEEE